MEAWKAILIAFGGNAALLAVLAWLAKSIVSEWLKRSTTEHQVIFSKLHEKRAEAIENIYHGLNEYVTYCKEFIMKAEHVEEGERHNLLANLGSISKNFRDVFQNNKLYLKKDLCKQIEMVFKNSQMPSYNFIFSLGSFVSENISENEYRKEWEKAFLVFTENIPQLLERLETEFRSLLGTENYSYRDRTPHH